MSNSSSLVAAMRLRDCPVCGAKASEAALFLHRSLDESRLTAASFSSRKLPEFMSYHLVRCRECAVVFACEAPAAPALADAYQEANYSTAEEAAFAAVTYRKALEPFLKRLAGRGIALEIGTGTGVFLSYLEQAGFRETIGIEPSQAAIDAAADAVRPSIRKGIFTGGEFPSGSLSFICCFQTLEHVFDPKALVESAFRMLEPGGMLALITHDYTALINRLLGSRSPIIDIEHLQLFNASSLRRLVSAAGYGLDGIVPVRNVYPLRYWMSLLPLSGSLKRAMNALARITGLGRVPVGLNVGNLLTVASKPL